MATAAFLQKLGFTINSEKPVLFPVSYTTDNTHKVFDRLFQNGSNSDWGKVTIYLHALSEYPSKLLGNNTNREQLQTIKVIVSSFSVTPYCQMYYRELENENYSPGYIWWQFWRQNSEEAAKKLKWWTKKIFFSLLHPLKFHLSILHFFLMQS